MLNAATAFGHNLFFWAYQEDQAHIRRDVLISFSDLPDGKATCQLEHWFKPAYPVRCSGSSAMKVWKVDRNLEPQDSWSNSPIGIAVLGICAVEQNSGSQVMKAIINSEQCQPTMTFRFEMYDDTEDGSVSFTQSTMGGFRMTVCKDSN